MNFKESEIYKLVKIITTTLLKFINLLTKKDKNSLFFFPHNNCRKDKYDIINNGADNVLKICDCILRDNRFNKYKISILVYDKDRIHEYIEYCGELRNVVNISFIPFNNRKLLFKTFCRAAVILMDNYYKPPVYKLRRQKVICLGYFVAPFKDDYIKIKKNGYSNSLKLEKLRNNVFDFHISTSDFCSRELSVDSLLYLPKYKTLGFPRNDIFFDDPEYYRGKIIDVLGFSPQTLLSYVPTHRDYERRDNFLYDKTQVHMHSLFGLITPEEESALNKFLEDEDVVIIAKAHPIQEQSVITETSSRRIVYFSDLIDKAPINLMEIMAASDLMATDYSTACFDYLLTDRPCIYYFYDYEAERKSRTFFIDPIAPLCAGDIVYNITEFMQAIKANVATPEKYAEKRRFVRDLLFLYNDGKSSERIKDFILELDNAAK